MTDEEKIAALAAELERIGKMPKWTTRVTESRWGLTEHLTYETIVFPETVLAALSGIAYSLCARNRVLVYTGMLRSRDGEQWIVCHPITGDQEGYATEIEALIAALKLIEKKEVKE